QITVAGNVTLNGPNTLLVDVPTIFSGAVAGPGSLTQSGSDILTLSGINTFTGATMVTDGDVAINGTQPGSPVGVIGGTRSGLGQARPVTVGPAGPVEPGTPQAGGNNGTLSAPYAGFSEGGTLEIQVNNNPFTGAIQSSSLNLGAGTVLFGGSAPFFSTFT